MASTDRPITSSKVSDLGDCVVEGVVVIVRGPKVASSLSEIEFSVTKKNILAHATGFKKLNFKENVR